MADVANQVFLPWVQPGVVTNYPDASIDKLGTAVQPSVINMTVGVVVNTEPPINKAMRVYGPGDVTGIDPHQVVRTEPKRSTTDFEPNYFAGIEFDRPDFPWLFSPLKADAQGRLRPWMCLVVVRKQPGVELKPAGTQPLPTLNILAPAKPGDELPDLAESWAWAHVQLVGTAATPAAIKNNLDTDPTRNVSRLLSPRRLDPSTEYMACVVPTFAIGVKAGLGSAIAATDEAKLDPAWISGTLAPAQITLPVYYSWDFRTGVGGDFEELVRRLEPRELPPDVGKRPMDIGQPGFPMGLPANVEALLGLEGALRVLTTQPDSWPATTQAPFQNGLMPILNVSAQTPGDPIVAPPIYGRWHAGVQAVTNVAPPAPTPVAWFNELNLDPRQRVAAGLGTQVIQSQQELLMASAWEQLGEIQRVNQRKRQAQLSRSVNDRIHVKTFNRFSEETFLKVVAPGQSRIMIQEQSSPTVPPTTTPLIAKMASTFVPANVTSAPMRKLLRPRGAINRVFTSAQTPGATGLIALFNPLPTTSVPIPPPPPPPPVIERAGVTIDSVSNLVGGPNTVVRFAGITAAAIAAGAPIPPFMPDFRAGAVAHHQYLTNLFMTFIFADFRKVMNAPTIMTLAMASLSPAVTVVNAVAASLSIASPTLQTGDPLDPVMDAPSFPQPMYEALRDMSQDYLLPGVEHVPPNTVQLLQTNAKFIESFLVGLNMEMGRELLWRDYPTDQRGTYFRQFWDTAAAGAGSQGDIPPIHTFGLRALGTFAVGPGGDKVVLLIRGELLRRYPNTVIYAVRAVMQGGIRVLSTNPLDEVHPIFRGTLEPDLTFLGFNLTPAEVVASPGWFFVLQQQPTEPRFGMDDDPFGPGESGVIPPLTTWNDLNWAHVAPSAAALKALTHVSVKKVTLTPTTKQLGIWGRNSAHMAYITKQVPARVAIHASEMIPTVPPVKIK